MLNYCISVVSNYPGTAARNCRYGLRRKKECFRRFQESKLCLFRDFHLSMKPLFKAVRNKNQITFYHTHIQCKIPCQAGVRDCYSNYSHLSFLQPEQCIVAHILTQEYNSGTESDQSVMFCVYNIMLARQRRLSKTRQGRLLKTK